MMKTGFSTEKMYTYLKGYYSALGWKDAIRALAFARAKHGDQYRKSGEPYLIHPLTMACHAAALGIKSEAVAATCLLHDVCEDCGIDPRDLPVEAQRIKDAVRLLTHQKGVPLEDYYKGIALDPIAGLAKILDRCDNVSTMAGVFSTEKTLSYIQETEAHVMPLWRTVKTAWPEFSDALFVLKYHILSVTAGLASVIPPEINRNNPTQIPNVLNYHSRKIIDYVAIRSGQAAAAPFKKAAKAIAWGSMHLPDIQRLGILSGELARSESDDAVAVIRAHIDAMRAIVRSAVNIAAAEMVERTANTRPIGKPDEIERLLRLLLQQTEPGSYSFIGVRKTVVQLQDELRSARATRFATYDDAAWLRYDNTPYMLKWLDMVCLH